ncbi:MAG: hypothetical protein LBK58_03750 [Prevotellaceae bacterium]|nr:hypothetical protein [Prevotellaceae bacterium]
MTVAYPSKAVGKVVCSVISSWNDFVSPSVDKAVFVVHPYTGKPLQRWRMGDLRSP